MSLNDPFFDELFEKYSNDFINYASGKKPELYRLFLKLKDPLDVELILNLDDIKTEFINERLIPYCSSLDFNQLGLSSEYQEFMVSEDEVKSIAGRVFDRSKSEAELKQDIKGAVINRVESAKRLRDSVDAARNQEWREFNETKTYLRSLLDANGSVNDSFFVLYDCVKQTLFEDLGINNVNEVRVLSDNINRVLGAGSNQKISSIVDAVSQRLSFYVGKFELNNTHENYLLLQDALEAETVILRMYLDKLEKRGVYSEFKEIHSEEFQNFLKQRAPPVIINHPSQTLPAPSVNGTQRTAVPSAGNAHMIHPQRCANSGSHGLIKDVEIFFHDNNRVTTNHKLGKSIDEFLLQAVPAQSFNLEQIVYSQGINAVDDITIVSMGEAFSIVSQSVINFLISKRNKTMKLQDFFKVGNYEQSSSVNPGALFEPILGLDYNLDILVNDVFPVFNNLFEESIRNNQFSLVQVFHYMGALVMPSRNSNKKCKKNDNYVGSFAVDANLLSHVRNNINVLPQNPGAATFRNPGVTFKGCDAWIPENVEKFNDDALRNSLTNFYRALYMLKKIHDNSSVDLTTSRVDLTTLVTL